MSPEEFALLREGDQLQHPFSSARWVVTNLRREGGKTTGVVIVQSAELEAEGAKDWVVVPRRRRG